MVSTPRMPFPDPPDDRPRRRPPEPRPTGPRIPSKFQDPAEEVRIERAMDELRAIAEQWPEERDG